MLVEIKDPRLVIHPPITYDLNNRTLNIELAPFIFVEESGNYSFYSIALENSEGELRFFRDVTDNVYEFTILDGNSIMVSESGTGRILGILRTSINNSAIEYIDIPGLDVYTKAIHPTIHSYAIFLTERGELYRLLLNDSKPSIELLDRCNLFNVRRIKACTSTVCLDKSYFHAVVSSKVYGFYVKLANKNSNHADYVSLAHGYIANNICFIKLGPQNYVLRLDAPDREIHFSELDNLRPLAILSNDTLVGVATRDDILTVVYLERDEIDTIAKVDLGELLDIDVDIEQNNLVLTYSGYVYVFNVSEKPKYIRLKCSDISSATLAKDSLIIFRKNAIDVYRLDIASNHIYFEKIGSGPRHLSHCKTLTQDILLCVDKLGRILVSRLRDLLLSSPYQYTPLRSSLGNVTYVYGVLSPLVVNSIHKEKYIRISSSKALVYIDSNEHLRELAYWDKTHYDTLNRVLIDIPEGNDDIDVVILGDKPIIINRDNYYEHLYTHLSIINGAKTINIPLNNKRIEGLNRSKVFEKFTKVFLAKDKGAVEFGIAIDRSKIKVIEYDNILNYYGDRVCLSEHLAAKLTFSDSVTITAICSNNVMRSPNTCIDLRPCKKLLKIMLEIGNGLSFSIPVQYVTTPRSIYVENIDRAGVGYNRGSQYLLLPRKCIDITRALLNLDRGRGVLVLSLVNRCKNVGAIINVKDRTLFIEPDSNKDLEIEIGFDDIISDNGIQVLVLEGTGSIHRYAIELGLEFFIARAIVIALKVAKAVGVRTSVTKNFGHVYRDSERRHR